MRLGSLFDGIAGFPLAASRHGITSVWASEIEPYPIAVSRRHFPNMRHLGDVTKIHGAEIEPADIITFGSPCTDLSVAGKRKGLGRDTAKVVRYHVKSAPEGWKTRQHPVSPEVWSEAEVAMKTRKSTRSGLFYHAVRIIREMREATKDGPEGPKPTIAIWENVPGAFSSNAGRDFATVLESLVGGSVDVPWGGWTNAGVAFGSQGQAAWRVVDAQFWGVPQRRRRIILVADFGGERAGQILFEPLGLSGDYQKGAQAGQGTAGSPADSPGASGESSGFGLIGHTQYRSGVTCPIRAKGGDCGGVVRQSSSPRSDGRSEVLTPQIDQCLTSGTGRRCDAETETLISVQMFDMTHADEVIRPVTPGLSPTLNARMGTGGNQIPVLLEPLAIDMQQVSQANRGQPSRVAPTLHQNGWAHVIEPAKVFYESGQGGLLSRPSRPTHTVVEPIAFGAQNSASQGDSVSDKVTPTLDISKIPAIAFENRHDEGVRLMGDKCNTLAQPVAFALRGREEGAKPEVHGDGDTVGALRASEGGSSRDYVAFPIKDVSHAGKEYTSTDGGLGVGGEDDPAFALDTRGNAGVAFADKTNQTGANGRNVSEEKAFGLNATDKQFVAVCYDQKDLGRRPAEFTEHSPTLKARAGTGVVTSPLSENQPATDFDVRNLYEHELSGTLQAKTTGGYSLNYQNPVRIGYAVRRLTPTECERLQGMPDGWTEWGIRANGKRINLSDTARYKALGNGLAIPPFEWLMKRIAAVLSAKATAVQSPEDQPVA